MRNGNNSKLATRNEESSRLRHNGVNANEKFSLLLEAQSDDERKKLKVNPFHKRSRSILFLYEN